MSREATIVLASILLFMGFMLVSFQIDILNDRINGLEKKLETKEGGEHE